MRVVDNESDLKAVREWGGIVAAYDSKWMIHSKTKGADDHSTVKTSTPCFPGSYETTTAKSQTDQKQRAQAGVGQVCPQPV